jgi:hypothetical protein
MVELCFCFLVFFCLMLGVFDFGQFLFIHQALVERARWALRYGIANHTANTDATAATTADTTCAGDGSDTALTTCIQNEMLYSSSTAGTNGYFGLTSSMVQVSFPDQVKSDSTSPAPPPNSMPADTPTYETVQILITGYKYYMYAPYAGGTANGSYTGPNIYETFPLGQY